MAETLRSITNNVPPISITGWDPINTNDAAYEHSNDYGDNEANDSFGNKLISRFVQYSVSGITLVTIFMLIGFAVIGLMWSVLFERTALGKILEYRDIAGAFGVVNIVIAFVYSDWLNRSVRNFKEMPQQYVTLLTSVRSVASKISMYVLASSAEGEMSSNSRKSVMMAFDSMVALNYVLPRLFGVTNEIIAKPYSEALHQLIMNNMQNKSDPLEFLFRCNFEAGVATVILHKNGIIDSQGEREIMDELDKQRSFLDQIRIASLVKEPEIFNFHLSLIFAIYLFVVIPIQMYAEVNTLMPLLYPMIMFLFVGMIVYRWYVGDAFDDNGLYRGFKPIRIRADTQLFLQKIKDSTFEHRFLSITSNIK